MIPGIEAGGKKRRRNEWKLSWGKMQREENNVNVLTHQHTDLLHTWLAIIHIWTPWDVACILFLCRPTIKNCMLSTLMHFFQLIRRNNKAKLQISYFYPSPRISHYYQWMGRQMFFFISTNDSGIRTLQMKAFPPPCWFIVQFLKLWSILHSIHTQKNVFRPVSK